MAKLTITVPDGKYCNGCPLHNKDNFGRDGWCIFFREYVKRTAVFDEKCPACLEATKGEK